MDFKEIFIHKDNKVISFKISEFTFTSKRNKVIGPLGGMVPLSYNFSLEIRSQEMYDIFKRDEDILFHLQDEEYKYFYGAGDGEIKGRIKRTYYDSVVISWIAKDYPIRNKI